MTMIPKADTASNTSFSRVLPMMQLAIDSTSLGEFKTCPRKYYYRVVLGIEPVQRSFHLTFGILYHAALERYDHKKAEGLGHDDALDFALDYVLRETWDHELGRPWISGDQNKTRGTLVRSIVDYLDRFGQDDPMQTVILVNGKPAVELSFSFWSGFTTESTGEPILFCGHLDRLANLNSVPYVVDRKTSKHTIGASWFAQFSPYNQFSMYVLASQIVYKVEARDLIVDGAQIAVGFTRFERGVVHRDRSQIEEWHRDAGWTIRTMEQCAREEYWPMNDSACGNYGGCPFRGVCSKPAASREQWLVSDYVKAQWDPLQRRGDI